MAAIVPSPGTAGVGLIHALSLGGVEIVTVGKKWPPLLGRFSRFPKRHVFYDPERESLADCLLRIAGDFADKPVLFPAIDMDLEPIVEQRARLSESYHVPAADHIGADIFAKNWQYDLAERVGVPIPLSKRFLAGDNPDLADFRYPLILKPSARTESDGGRAFRLKVFDDAASFESCLRALERDFAGREFQIAENIPGDPTALVTVGAYANREGRVLRTYTGRKVSQHPYSHGDASVAESIELPGIAIEQAVKLLEGARFHGISQVEFKYDARDDLYKLIEINGRSWSWIKLPAYSGANLPLIQYYDLTSDPRLEKELASPQRHDIFLVREQLVRLNRLPLEQQLIADLESRKQRISAVYDRRDPLLSAVYAAANLAGRLRKGPGASL
jgi:predicted ATP-grasp superfamily ATP-dependent carboligase